MDMAPASAIGTAVARGRGDGPPGCRRARRLQEGEGGHAEASMRRGFVDLGRLSRPRSSPPSMACSTTPYDVPKLATRVEDAVTLTVPPIVAGADVGDTVSSGLPAPRTTCQRSIVNASGDFTTCHPWTYSVYCRSSGSMSSMSSLVPPAVLCATMSSPWQRYRSMSSSVASTYDRRRYAVSVATSNDSAIVVGNSHPSKVWSGSWLTEPVSWTLPAMIAGDGRVGAVVAGQATSRSSAAGGHAERSHQVGAHGRRVDRELLRTWCTAGLHAQRAELTPVVDGAPSSAMLTSKVPGGTRGKGQSAAIRRSSGGSRGGGEGRRAVRARW